MRDCVKPYQYWRNEITVEGDCLLWGILSKKLQENVLIDVHRDHQGIARMKANAKSYVWWPELDKSLEKIAKDCQACKSTKSMPAVAPLHSECTLTSRMFFVLVDAHSKWPEVAEMKLTTAERTIEVTRTIFGSHGTPYQVVSDNWTQFTSKEFAEVHPITPQPMKGLHRMKGSEQSERSFNHRLVNFLLLYHTTLCNHEWDSK